MHVRCGSIYVYLHIYIYIYMQIHICIYIYIYIGACTCVNLYNFIRICANVLRREHLLPAQQRRRKPRMSWEMQWNRAHLWPRASRIQYPTLCGPNLNLWFPRCGVVLYVYIHAMLKYFILACIYACAMCVYICVFVYIYIYIYTDTHIYIYIYVIIYVYIYIP